MLVVYRNVCRVRGDVKVRARTCRQVTECWEIAAAGRSGKLRLVRRNWCAPGVAVAGRQRQISIPPPSGGLPNVNSVAPHLALAPPAVHWE